MTPFINESSYDCIAMLRVYYSIVGCVGIALVLVLQKERVDVESVDYVIRVFEPKMRRTGRYYY